MYTAKSIRDMPASAAHGQIQSDGTVIVYMPGDVLPKTSVDFVPQVPQEITMRQARLALHASGKLAAVDAEIAALPDPPRENARITWEFSQTVDRHNPFVIMLAHRLGMSGADLDDLFTVAAEL